MTSISATKSNSSRRGGRPKMATEDVRKAYGVRLSKREREEARQRAEEAGLDLSTYCRNAILNASSPRPVPQVNRGAWLQLSSLANALLIIARAPATSDMGPLPDQLLDLHVLLKSMRLALLGIHSPLDEEQ